MPSHIGETCVSFDTGIEDGCSTRTLGRYKPQIWLSYHFRNHSVVSYHIYAS